MNDIAMAMVVGFLFGIVIGVSLCAFLVFARKIPRSPKVEKVEKKINRREGW